MQSWIAFVWSRAKEPPKVSMGQLRMLALRAGASRPRTYLQHGNLAFDAEEAQLEDLLKGLGAAIKENLHPDLDLVVRSDVELHRAAARCPYDDPTPGNTEVQVGWLEQAPDAAAARALQDALADGDEVEVLGSEVFLRSPDAATRERLSAAFLTDKLGVGVALRSWNTVVQMQRMAPVELAAEPARLGGGAVVLGVSDLARSVAFYRDQLGFRCISEQADGAELRGGGLTLVLERGEPLAGLALRFRTADPRAFADALEEQGVSVERVDGRVSFRDPDGTSIRVG